MCVRERERERERECQIERGIRRWSRANPKLHMHNMLRWVKSENIVPTSPHHITSHQSRALQSCTEAAGQACMIGIALTALLG